MDIKKKLESLQAEYRDILLKLDQAKEYLNNVNTRRVELEGAIKALSEMVDANETDNKSE